MVRGSGSSNSCLKSYTLASAGLMSAGAIAFGVRFHRATKSVGTNALSHDGLSADFGNVQRLEILPLVERRTSDPCLRGEPGVSYLIRADEFTILFDCGFGRGSGRSALEENAKTLGVDLRTLDAVVISHAHFDHVGGLQAWRHRSFRITGASVSRDLPAYAPTSLQHAKAKVIVVDGPLAIAPGVAIMPPLAAALFWLGPVLEQALVVCVKGFGLVVVSGCGHPPLDRVLSEAERVTGIRIRAIVGGLHLPVHPWGDAMTSVAVIGSSKWPWKMIDESDAHMAVKALTKRQPELVALSHHDSSAWTHTLFSATFGPRYRSVRVGDPIIFEAPSLQDNPQKPVADQADE